MNRIAGTILSSRRKGSVTWQARIGADRGRFEVVRIAVPSSTPAVIEPLTEHELLELLDCADHDGEAGE